MIRRAIFFGALVAAATGLVWLGTPTPFVTVMSSSMTPTFHVGDVVLVQELRGHSPKVGDIVEIDVPLDVQRDQHYPERIVHRVAEISGGQLFTKGDNVDHRDPFSVPVSSVHKKVLTVVPAAGRLVAFIVSPFGMLWIIGGIVLLVGGPLVESVRGRVPVAAAAAAPDPMLQQLLVAVTEYGEHLKSHTAIVQSMAEASKDLSEAARELRGNPLPTPVLTAIQAAPPPAPAPKIRLRPRQLTADRRTEPPWG